jgi:tripartite-type tricarboxylate transporter receptor subunit TctC
MAGRRAAAFVLAWLCCLGHAAAAEPPLTIIVAYSPGGSTDSLARILGARMQEKLGRPIIIETRPGATGQIGTRYAARSAPDGNTIQIAAQTTHAVAPSLYRNPGYDPVKDFTPIILVAWSPLVLVSHPALPVKDVAELIAHLKARPGTVSYGTGGRGDGSHMASLLFNRLAKVEAIAVPFHGDGQAVPQLLGNHVSYMFTGVPVTASSIHAGQLKGLAVTSKVRLSVLPDVPTVDESGLPGYDMVNWWGVFAPAGVRRDFVDKINKVISEIIQEPATRDKLRNLGFEMIGSSPEEFRDYLAAETAKWAGIIKSEKLAADQN